MSQADKLMMFLNKFLAQGNSPGVESMMKKLPFEKYGRETQDLILSKLLCRALEEKENLGSKEITEIVYSRWASLALPGDKLSIRPYIINEIGKKSFEFDYVKVLMNRMKFSYRQIVMELIPYGDTRFVEDVLNYLNKSLGYQSFECYMDILEELNQPNKTLIFEEEIPRNFEKTGMVEDLEIPRGSIKDVENSNIYVIRHIEAMASEVSPYAPRPSYILDTKIVEYPSDEVSIIPKLYPDPEKAFEIMEEVTQGIYSDDTNPDSKREAFLDIYNHTENTYARSGLLLPVYIKHFLNDDMENPDLARVYGPLNPFVVDEDSGMELDGRMFSCNVYREDYIERECTDPQEWFLGYCEYNKCNRKIKQYHHAFRVPMASGGWAGCYCSPEHAAKDGLPKHVGNIDDALGPRNIMKHLLRHFVSFIKENGIYDRDDVEIFQLSTTEYSKEETSLNLEKSMKEAADLELTGFY